MQSDRMMALHLLALGLSLLMLAGCRANSIVPTRSPEKPQNLPWIEAKLGTVPLRLMIARTDRERQWGLMFRPDLGENEGMLFVHDRPEIMSFWMKNTRIPLDLVCFSPDLTVTEWILGLRPDQGGDPPLYASRKEAQYALEIASGSVSKWGIRAGDRLELPKESSNGP